MKRIRLFLIFALLIFMAPSIFAQGFQPPASGKAVVYFVRITKYGSGVSFEYFHNDKYIGAFKGRNYMRYECDPGEQLFWASSENREFLTADLQEGKTYLVLVDVILGFWKGHVGLSPIDMNDQNRFEAAKELIMSNPPVEITQKDLDKRNKKLEKFIKKELEHYEQVSKNKHEFHHIAPDSFIPEEYME